MSLQVIWRSETPTVFPTLSWEGGATAGASRLRALFYSVTARMLIGFFSYSPYDPDDPYLIGVGNAGVTQKGAFCRLWRDGTRLTFQHDGPLEATVWLGSHQPYVTRTDDGRVGWAPDEAYGGELLVPGDALITQALGNTPIQYYRVNDFWPQDIHTAQPLGNREWLAPNSIGVLRPSRQLAYSVTTSYPGNLSRPVILEQPSGIIRWQGPPLPTPATYSQVRDLQLIDTRTAMVLFRQGATYDEPYLARVLDLTTSAWTLKWEDELPGSAHVAAYDPINQIIYAMGQWPGGQALVAARFKRAPVTVAVPTLVGASALHELTPTNISTLITDGLGSAISHQLVCWTLSASLSGGAFSSAYSLTNASGVATITYVGPWKPPAGLTERVSAAVSDLEG